MSNGLSIFLGLAVLTLGAETLIRGATALARRFGLSELLIGLTLVGFGTSTPELVSSVQAALVGSPGVAVGNVVGSNIANVLLILGVAALIAPIAVEPKSFRRDSIAVALATVVVIAVSMTGAFTRLAGAGFLVAIALYIVVAYLTERNASDPTEKARHEAEAASLPTGPRSMAIDIVLALVGLVLLMVGARFLVTGAIAIAADFGVSETIIGLTIVAVGTSLPELVTSAVAAFRGKSALALGNVVGSNIYNLLFILGATAAIHPVAVPPEIIAFDNWAMLAATITMILFARTKQTIARWEGALLVGAYAIYIGWLVVNAA